MTNTKSRRWLWWAALGVLVVGGAVVAWANRYEYPDPRMRVNRFTGCTEIFGQIDTVEESEELARIRERFGGSAPSPQIGWKKTNC